MLSNTETCKCIYLKWVVNRVYISHGVQIHLQQDGNQFWRILHTLKYGEVIQFYTWFNLNFRLKMKVKVLVTQSCPALCDAMDSILPRSLSIGFSSKNTGVGCHFFLQRIFPTQRSNSGLPHCGQILYHLSHQGSPITYFIFEDSSFIVCSRVSLYL